VLSTLGPRVKPYDPEANKLTLLYEETRKLDEQMTILRKRRNPRTGGLINSYNPTPEYSRLRRRYALLQKQLDEINKKQRVFYKGRRVGSTTSTSSSDSLNRGTLSRGGGLSRGSLTR
jgi:hypothetical protein